MNYAWNIGASGVFTSLYRQDVAANNLANIETVGFKSDESFTIPRQAVRQEDGLESMPSNAMLERLGAGVLLAPNRTQFTQGVVTPTGNPLDLAIDGDGFLSVESAKPGQTALSRDGRLTLDKNARLIRASDGRAVLDGSGKPITLDASAEVVIDGDGTIRQRGEAVARLAILDVPDRRALRKQGDGTFALAGAAAKSLAPATGTLVQGAVERSAADPIQALMSVQNAMSAFNANFRVMQMHDELMNRAINTFGRVTA